MTNSENKIKGRQDIIVMQSCDPFVYFDMLQTTSKTAIELCHRSSLSYQMFVGFKRGEQNWHASYNRIVMLKELLDRSFRGWVLWLDADAYVVNLDFDIRRYLYENEKKALIVCKSGSSNNLWDVNNGVFMLNFNHSEARALIYGWNDAFFDISEQDFLAAPAWHSIPDDQAMFQWQLKHKNNLNDYVKFEEFSFINSMHASFIRQIMRTHERDIVRRGQRLSAEVERVLSSARMK